MFQISKFNIEGSYLNLEIQAKQEEDDLNLSFRIRDNERWVLIERNQEFLIPLEKKSDKYIVGININDIVKTFPTITGKRNVIDIHIKRGHKYEKLTVNREIINYIRSINAQKLNELLNIKYYVINNETVGIQLLSKDLTASVRELSILDDKIKISVDTFLRGKKVDVNHESLIIKQRSVANSPQTYIYQFPIFKESTGEYIINSSDFIEKFKMEDKEIFDFVIEYRLTNFVLHIPLNTGQMNFAVKNWFLNEFYKLDLLRGKTGNLSIRYVHDKLKVKIDEVILNEDKIVLQMMNVEKIQNIPVNLQLRSFIDGMKNNDMVIFYEKEIIFENNSSWLTIDIKELFGSFVSTYPRKYKLFLEIGNKLFSIEKSGFEDSILMNNCKVNCKFEDTITLEVSIKDTKPTSIAIMGSCFSRAAFNSSADYFNPDYKKYFKVSYSYFWPTMLSLVSKSLNFDRQWFADHSEDKIVELEWEFLKNWDKALKDSGTEYLLIDFFVDAMHGVLQIEEDKYISRNLYTRKTDYYHSSLLIGSKSFDSYHPGYFEEWTKAFDIFIEKVKNIIPEERMILNLSLLTEKYYDESGGISSFFEAKHITRAHFLHVNNVWTKMNNYFMAKLPNAHVLDMNKFNYISKYDAPADLAPCGPHHFESGYYKSIVNELNKIISISERVTV